MTFFRRNRTVERHQCDSSTILVFGRRLCATVPIFAAPIYPDENSRRNLKVRIGRIEFKSINRVDRFLLSILFSARAYTVRSEFRVRSWGVPSFSPINVEEKRFVSPGTFLFRNPAKSQRRPLPAFRTVQLFLSGPDFHSLPSPPFIRNSCPFRSPGKSNLEKKKNTRRVFCTRVSSLRLAGGGFVPRIRYRSRKRFRFFGTNSRKSKKKKKRSKRKPAETSRGAG